LDDLQSVIDRSIALAAPFTKSLFAAKALDAASAQA